MIAKMYIFDGYTWSASELIVSLPLAGVIFFARTEVGKLLTALWEFRDLSYMRNVIRGHWSDT